MTETAVRLSLSVSEELFQDYQAQADRAGVNVEHLIADRLEQVVSQTDSKPLYVTDAQRKVLERILGRNVNSPQRLVMEVEKLATVEVAGVAVSIPVDLLVKVKSRSFRAPYQDVLKREILLALERFVGIR